jgi:hypothetical protein
MEPIYLISLFEGRFWPTVSLLGPAFDQALSKSLAATSRATRRSRRRRVSIIPPDTMAGLPF